MKKFSSFTIILILILIPLTYATGQNLVTNGDFQSGDTDWIKGTGWSIIDLGGSDWVAHSDGTQSTLSNLTQSSILTFGKKYLITFTVSNYSAGTVKFVASGGATVGTPRSANGTYTEITANTIFNDTNFHIQADADFIGDIDDVSVELATITVASPNGGESWQAGSNQTITWSDNLIENVKIELFKGGAFDSEIVASTESDGSYNWDIPSSTAAASDYSVVISDASTGAVADTSDANFTISGTLSVTSPNGGENFRTGSAQTITWTDNISENVKIELYKGGSLDSEIVSSTESDGSYLWSVPSVPDGSDYTVVITSTSTGTIADTSDANFSIFTPTITVTAPNGAENWQAGSSPTISWSSSNVTNVKIELFKAGVLDSVLTASTASDGSFEWTIPASTPAASDYKVVITDASDGTVADTSDADFSITGLITLTSPNGGENYEVASAQTITWTDNISETVKIELFKGGSFNSTIIASTPSDGSHPWTVPVVADGSDYTVVITSTSTPTVADTSDANFSIFNPIITVTSPNGGEIFDIGNSYDITWTDNTAENVKIELFKAGSFNSTIVASTPSDGTYNWTVPAVTEASDYTVVITSTATGTVADTSDANFTIQTSGITVTSPNGGEIFDIGNSYDITWSDNIAEAVKIELFKAGTFNSTIVGNTPSDGTYNWTVPAITEASDYTVVITSTVTGTVADTSDANFTIQTSGITVTSPNGGEIFDIGNSYDITWSDNIAEAVKIELFKTGTFNSTIVASTPSDGTYNWTVPAITEASDYTVVITSTATGTVADTSDANFTIQTSGITVISPNGGEIFDIGNSYDITWSDNIAEAVKIELFKAGSFNSTIIGNTPSDGTYNWTVPAITEASDYTVVITSTTAGTIADTSDANFTIQTSVITVTSPNGGEIFDIGNSYDITWSDNIAEAVKIELFKAGAFNSTIVGNTPSDGTYNWTVPAVTEASDYTVVITSTATGTVADTSDANFTIQTSGITVTSPNGGEIFDIGNSYDITWSDNIAEAVKIELFKAGSFNSTIVGNTPSDGTYNWTIPAVTEASDYTVVITSTATGTVADTSDANFTIQTSGITVTSPNGGEIFDIGNSYDITWTDNIAEAVKIELFKAGSFNSTIVGNTPSDGTYNWTVPSITEASDYTVVITSTTTGTIADTSDANFTIQTSVITVTSPNGGEIWERGASSDITWTDNIAEKVKIELYKGGAFDSVIIDSTESDGTYSWNIPGATVEGTDYKIKVTSVTNGSLSDTSDANFTIQSSGITVTSPNGGESWEAGSTQTITWTDNIVENVKIELYKGGVFNSEIVATTASDGSYDWDILLSTTPASDYTIVITSVNTGSVTDASDADFTIFAPITVTVPNGGESWARGFQYTITWNDTFIEDVKIDLYKGGVFYSELFASTPSDGSKFWDIPDSIPIGSDYKIKLSKVTDSTVFDFSDANFTVGSFELTIPNGGESWAAGSFHQIKFKDVISDLASIVDFELWKGGAFDRLLFENTDADGSKDWDIPNDLTPGSDYRIKIFNHNDPSDFDFSDADFTITPFLPTMTLTAPNGGENWQAGTQQIITWTDNIDEAVRIELWKGGVFNSLIIDNTPSDGSKIWEIPIGTTPGSDYKVKIISTVDTTLFAISDADFTILGYVPQITITVPNGGESWQSGIEQTITWNDNIPDNEFVKIELYKGGVFNTELFASTFADDSKFWTIPVTTSPDSDYTIKITSVDDSTVFDFSDNPFTIYSPITVTAPNGGETWEIGTSHTITWTDSLAENVKIELFKTGIFNTEIISSTPSNGSFVWNIPGALTPATDYTVRITSVLDNNVYDVSDADFTLFFDNITVTSPNGGENWRSGSTQTITWTDNIAEDVKIELFKGGTLNSTLTASTPSNGSYIWNIPGGTPSGSDYSIKISSVNDSTLSDFSDANFSIYLPTITVISPNGGETWLVGTNNNITWSDNIPENVKIELFKGGVFNSEIVASTTSDGLRSWIIPQVTTPGSDYTIKITSVDSSNVFDLSDAIFTIDNPITVTVPNGGEGWEAGTTQTITWNDNLIENVKIELFKSGVLNSVITPSTLSDGSFDWNIPGAITPASDYTIRITSTFDPNFSDESDTTFTIFLDNITVTTPNGGENWRSGSIQTITWTDNIAENVKIELYKGGIFNSLIANSTESDSSYDWVIPAGTVSGSDYKIMITSTIDTGVTDLSDSDFSIYLPTVTVTSPNGGESWQSGTSKLVTWTDNLPEAVKIDLFKGGTFNSAITDSTPSNGSFLWDIPGGLLPGSDYTIKITSADSSNVFDFSNANFTIVPSTITVTNPDGGESWRLGTPQVIMWTDNIVEDVKIELFKGGIFNSTIIDTTASDGSKNWTVPTNLTPGNDYKVKITSVSDPAVFDLSDGNFEIFASTITVNSPVGGESWQAGTQQTIVWTDNIDENVRIELFKSGAFQTLIDNTTQSDGARNWEIPFAQEPGTDYKVKITSVDSSNVFDFSDSTFTIFSPSITVMSPNGGENWLTGSEQLITWIDNIAENVEIQLYKGGVFDSQIIASHPSDGSYTWNIPFGTTPGTDYKVRIFSTDNGIILDESDSNFTISNEVVVTSPNGFESWLAASNHTITWDDNLTENVKIELFKGGVFDSEITASTPSTGSYSWDIPAGTNEGSDYKVKITSINDTSVFDFSDDDFSIITPNISVTSPIGGESWQAGGLQQIFWSDNIPVNVKIDLYKGGAFHSEIISSTPSDGSKDWDIPFALEGGTDYTVKITSVADASVFDFSDSNFTIIGNVVTVTSPNGGETLLESVDHEITWTDNLTGSVEIQLFKGGVFDSEITGSTPSDGSYTWNIPGAILPGNNYTIKIASIEDGNVFDVSDSNFTIINNDLIVNAPNGGESWLTSSTQEITWTDDISGNVKIDLYKNETFNTTIVASTESDGSYDWTIPGATVTGSDYKVRITSVDQPVLFDQSNNSFTIFTGGITVSSPNGGESWQAGTTYPITWSDNIIENVKIDLYKSGAFHSTIDASTGSDGTRNWDIPFTLVSGTDYKVRIASVDNPSTLFDLSDSNFTVIGNEITVTNPDTAGIIYPIGSTEIITWSSSLTGNVEIQLFKAGVFNSSIVASTPNDGSFTWNITDPSIIQGSDYKVKISSVNDGSVFDFSDNDFTLSSEITVTIPNGGESWQQGTTHTINWTDNLNENVKIELFKGGVFDSEIISTTPSDGSFSWDIPLSTPPGLDYTVKITSVNNTSIFDFSDSNFEIFAGNITILQPNGGESWQAGTTYPISWTDNISENVVIDLYKNDTLYTVIDPSTNSDGTRNWSIPFDFEGGTDYKIKITSVDDPGINDISDANFTIIGNQITVISPNGGESYLIGTSQIITWTDNIPGNVEIQLFKGGVFNSSITTSTASDGSYTWNISTSLVQGSDYRIKITSQDDNNIFDFSDTDFTLSNEIIVAIPNGGESWQQGSTHTISWSDNLNENVKIELFKGGVFNLEISPSTLSNGSYSWDIPVITAPGLDYSVKITSVDNASVFDFSDSNFEIFAPFITLLSPNGGESWQAGASRVITWVDNINEDVSIDLYKGGVFHTSISASTGSDGTRGWDIPFDFEGGNDYKVKITSVNDPGISDFSDSNFTIVANQITVTSPNGGESWLETEDQEITWSDNLTGSVEIQLFKGGVFYSSIVTSTPSDGSFTWNPPAATSSGDDYRIKILSVDNGNVSDQSDADFTIVNNDLAVVTPNGGENWLTNTSQDITWTTDITGNVKIDLYKGGVFDLEIIASTPGNNNLYSWTIPGSTATGSDYKIRITSIDQPVLFDESNASFTIFTGGITVSSPNGGESWQAGTTKSITWADNIIEDVKIELYKAGLFHTEINPSTTSDGTSNWDIPFDFEGGSDYTVKITSVDNPAILTDFSDSNFTIVANQITVTSPNGGESWLETEDQEITWSDNLSGNVEIQLFKAGGFHSSITTSTPSDGSFTWNPPAATSTGDDYRIKILSVDNGNVSDQSDADFTIVSNDLAVVTPNGGENWLTNTSQDITWTTDITGDVKIDLYKGGVLDLEIIASTPGSNNLYSWTIPGSTATGSDYKIRITSVDQPVLFDESNTSFTIFTGGITVSSPDGGESWQAGTTKSITWADNIAENVKIDLYKGGIFYTEIDPSTSSDGTFNWDIPFDFEGGSDYTVKITSVVNPGTLFDFSDSNFTIVANQITVTSPNGGEQWLDTEDHIITWSDNLAGNVEIQLFKGGVFNSSIISSTPSDSAYTWDIPGTTPSGDDYSIKILSVENGNIFDQSDADFTIVSNDLAVVTPNGGENWLTNTSQDITWTTDVSGNVKIDLYKGGVFDSEIIAATPGSNNLYSWTIPGSTETGSDYKIRITSIDQPALFDESNASFTIFTGGITLSSPNGGESWQAGTTKSITWADNIAENIKIDLYKGGIFYTEIDPSTSSDGTFNWDIPFDFEGGSDYTVKITSVVNPGTLFDFSDSNFTIVANQITVTSPNGGEQWLDTEDHIITWSDNLAGNVEIQLFKGGVFNSSIISSTPSDSAYTWDIPGTTPSGDDYIIKILSVDNGNISDQSDADFTIVSNDLAVVTPNGGENWLTNTSQDITWTTDVSGNVKIDLYKGGVFDSEIIAATPGSNNLYSWTIPGSTTTGSDYKIRITSIDQPALFDESNASFTIFTGGITVSSPNGGESWQAGETRPITWADNIAENVKIDLYKGGLFYTEIDPSTSSDGTFNWDIPFDFEGGSDYTVKITSVVNPAILFDFSDSNFTIVANQITVTSPNGGESWLETEDQEITWTDNLAGNVEIQLFKAGGFHSSITTSTPSDGSFTWNPPAATPSGDDYRIKILSVDNGNVSDQSDADFTIVSNDLAVVTPNGGENWLTNTSQDITWTTDITGNVKIDLYKGGVFDSEIIASTPGSNNLYSWTIPGSTATGSDYKIRITSVDQPVLFDESNASFTIFTGGITVSSPNGGESWQAGTTKSITWADNIIEDVKIELYKAGLFHTEINPSTTSDGITSWPIPFDFEGGSDYKVKITSVDNPAILVDFSDSTFTIVANQITVTSPNGGESWLETEDQEITWSDNLTGSVEIQLFKGGVFYSSIVTSTPSDGSFTWNPPGATPSGDDYRIKILSVDNGNVSDQSDADFTIVSNDLTVVTPNGGENWLTNTSQDITWTTDITGDVKIDLYKGGVFDSEIIASTPGSNNLYSWTIPGSTATGSDYKIRITSVDQPVLFDESNTSFTIFTGGITVSSPNGGESWQAGETRPITWADNIAENIKIDLYKGGIFYTEIDPSTSSDGTFNWDIPFDFEGGSDYTVKITSVVNPGTLFDFSDANFTIIANQITVTSPNGGESWLDTEDQIITWTDNLAGNVEIQLFKGGVFYSSIVTSTPSDGEYTWNIPGTTPSGSDYKVKIISVDDGNIFDLSDADFTIVSNDLAVVTPNGGENWLTNTSQDITWTTDITGNVKIDLYKGGVFDSEIIASTPGSNNLYSWTIPGSTATGSDYKIRITSVDQPVLFDESNASFTIFTGGITVSSPNGGESWQAGTTKSITWADNIIEDVKIELYKAGLFHTEINPSTTSDGTSNWDIPFDFEGGSDYTVKITSVVNPAILVDFSDSTFTIVANQITVTSPNGGESWLETEDQEITWTDNLTGSVEIQLFKAGGFHSSITTSTPSDGSFTWNPPAATPSGDDYRIKILSVDNGNVFDLSDADFTIVSNDLTVVTPNGGENWLTNTSQDITWTTDITGNVKIDLYKGGVFDSEIIASTPGSNNLYSWTIPGSTATGSDYKIRITSVDQPVLFDESNASFTIFTGGITVSSPNGGESWQAGETRPITWADNIAENIKIDLYKGGIFYTEIDPSTSSDGTFNWDIPFDFEGGSDYTVKITSVVNPGTLFDFSDANFTIIANQITVTSPNGGEQWLDTEDQIITWTDNLAGNVEIQLFKGGVFYSSIVTSTPSDGEYTWNIPGTTPSGSDYKVKIISVDDGNIFDLSDADFTIVSNDLAVVTPNGGENWLTNTSQDITWTTDITGNVKIDLYKGGVFDSEIIASTPGSNNLYSWTIPGSTATGSDYKIRITSVDQPVLFDESNASFTIFTGGITVSSPNGGESWQAGETRPITWADNIAENVKIDLYKGGIFYTEIDPSTSSDGTFNWDIPFDFEGGSDYTVKITSVVNPGTLFDFSDANFTIIANQITVTSPNGGESWLDTEDQIITWTDNLAGNVEIQLFKGGVFYSSIVTSTPSDGEYTWNIPGTTPSGSDYKVKIISVDDGNIFDLSDADFTIVSNDLAVVTPNGGENWLTNTSQDITWTTDITGNVKIDLYKGGVFDSEIIASTPGSNNLYSWTIPGSTATGSDYKIRITSVDQPVLFDESNASFTIFTGGITVSSPNGGESWQAGTTKSITWADNIIEDVKIELYKAGLFHTEINPSTTSDGTSNWDIPFDFEGGSDYTVKITSVVNPAILVDFSDSTFTIVANQITVTSPNGGESWLETEDQEITWTDNLTGSVEIQLFKAGGFHSSITTSTPSDGSFTWNPPAATPSGDDYRIKILSVDNGNVFDLSDADFTIVSNDLAVVTPNGGENWLTNTSQDITWTTDITGNVKIDLYKGGVFDSEIIASTPGSNNLYSWTIPGSTTTGSDYKIRITSIDQPVLFDESNANFTMFTGGITVSSPNGGESWQAGSSQIVTWADNITEDVKIDLYNGGLFHTEINPSTTSDGTSNWIIPFDFEGGSDYKVKITSVHHPSTIFDFSDANFTIIANQITVTSPNGSENYLVGSSHIITWTDNLFTGNVEIQLFKGGVFNSSITTSTAPDGSYTWNISDNLVQGSDYKIRISSVTDGNIFDFSDADFTLSNEVIVTVPNGGESWQQGTTHTINWTDNLNENVKIELFNGGVFDSQITASTPSNGSFSWDIPVTTLADTDYTVKITSVNNASVFDFSDANFEIFEGNITVTSPSDGTESWSAGTTQQINWTDNINENVMIELFKGGTLNSIIVAQTSSDGTYNWDIPFTLESGSDYTVKITSVDDPAIFDYSDTDFTITGNQITVTSPNGGEIWLETDDQIITWTDNLTGSVEIQLFKSEIFYSSITTSTPSDESFTWNPPASTPTGDDYKLKLTSVDDAAIFDFSDSAFTIINNNITVSSPNGGENWLIGSTNTITWTDDISGPVKIELFKAGIKDTTIAVSTPSSGSYDWDFADALPGIDYKIKITSIDQPALFDISDNEFTLFSGEITVNSPDGGENWLAGSSQTIFWTDNIDGDIIIELYKGGVSDSTFSIISGPTASDGAKNWDLPFDIQSGDDYQVKITSVENPDIFDFSDANFSIEGFEITINSPNGGEVWYVGQDYNITWTDNLTGSIEIHLYKTGVFLSVIDASDPSDGIKPWSIPEGQETGSDYSIRIASTNNSNIFDFSDNTFTLAHNIVVESPNGGENWQAGSTQTITWSDNLVGNVKLELHKKGAWYSDIIGSAPSTGSYTWVIPADTEADIAYKVKVVSAEDTSVYDYSDDNFEIFAGSITVVSPNGGEILQAGSAYSINWTSDISENVKIDLYKGGSLHSIIVASTSNDGAYNWTDMPFTIESGSDYQVRIASTSNANTFDISDANFTIMGNEITVTAPNGGETWQIGEPYFITWDDNISGQIEIYLFKGNQLALVIDSSDPSDGSYAWTIPGNVQKGSDYKIQIVSRDNGDINDFSDAEFTITDIVSVENITNEIPDIFTLYQNYPNPFNPQTKIEFGLPEESTVSLKIYDLTGQEVDVVLDNENLYAGKFRFDFDASYLPSGIYFYVLIAKSNTSDLSIKETKKMILMK